MLVGKHERIRLPHHENESRLGHLATDATEPVDMVRRLLDEARRVFGFGDGLSQLEKEIDRLE